MLQVQVFQGLDAGEGGADAFGTGGAQGVALQIQALDVGTLLQELGKDLDAHVRHLVEGQVHVPQHLRNQPATFS